MVLCVSGFSLPHILTGPGLRQEGDGEHDEVGDGIGTSNTMKWVGDGIGSVKLDEVEV